VAAAGIGKPCGFAAATLLPVVPGFDAAKSDNRWIRWSDGIYDWQ
jgi:hypothetical protein